MSPPPDKNSDEYKAYCNKQSESAKKRWENLEERDKQSQTISKSWENDAIRESRRFGRWGDSFRSEEQSKIAIKRWSDPSEREKQSKSAIKRWSDPKEIANQSSKAIKRWENPLNRELQAIMILERRYGGIWYGNVTYYDNPQYCEKFNSEFKERVRAFREYVCFECGQFKI
jgi:hypothetical protein